MRPGDRAGPGSAPEKLGWWLLPAEQEARTLSRAMQVLAERLGAPVFAPHVTLASGPLETLETVLARAREEPALELEVSGLVTTADLARTLTLRFEGEERVAELAWRLHPQARRDARAPAHLSLVYAHLGEERRAELLRETPAPLARIRFDRVAAVRMFTGELRIEDVARWREVARVSLTD